MVKICEPTPWLARLRVSLLAALLFAVGSCSYSEPLTVTDDLDSGSEPREVAPPSMAVSFAGGIPFGLFDLPSSWLGTTYNGMERNARILVETGTFKSKLADIKSRGGKVILQLTGVHDYYLDSYGHFSMTKWKNRLEMFRSIDFNSYINDGTIIAHYLVDEPNDPSNWGGTPIPPATVEAMAKYSKQLWPGMATVVRAEASYMANWTGTYVYLDGAWAQWVARKGDPLAFITRNVADAKKKGLSLVMGLNITKGYYGSPLTASQTKSAGSALLSSSYPCAFISWEWDPEQAGILTTTAMKDALSVLRYKAQHRTTKTCKS